MNVGLGDRSLPGLRHSSPIALYFQPQPHQFKFLGAHRWSVGTRWIRTAPSLLLQQDTPLGGLIGNPLGFYLLSIGRFLDTLFLGDCRFLGIWLPGDFLVVCRLEENRLARVLLGVGWPDKRRSVRSSLEVSGLEVGPDRWSIRSRGVGPARIGRRRTGFRSSGFGAIRAAPSGDDISNFQAKDQELAGAIVLAVLSRSVFKRFCYLARIWVVPHPTSGLVHGAHDLEVAGVRVV